VALNLYMWVLEQNREGQAPKWPVHFDCYVWDLRLVEFQKIKFLPKLVMWFTDDYCGQVLKIWIQVWNLWQSCIFSWNKCTCVYGSVAPEWSFHTYQTIYQTISHHIQEDHNLYIHHLGNQKSQKVSTDI
jgi:hypothetical protein